jgi:hypothetical protein
MATQLAEVFQPDDGAQEGAGAPVERDYEAEAREIGWLPAEEFKGPPEGHVDAKTFVERGETFLPMIKKERDRWKTKFQALERDLKQATKHFSAAEQRGYERGKAEIEARLDAAAEVGDVAGVRKANQDMLELQKGAIDAPKADGDIALEAKEAEIDWREKNPWYDKNTLARDYANLIAEKNKAKALEMAPADFFEFITDEVTKRYPDVAAKPVATERKPINPVEGGATNRRAAGGKGWADMDPEERRIGQAMAARWVKSGILKSADDYLKTYDWSKK